MLHALPGRSLLHPLCSDVLFPVLQYADDTLLIKSILASFSVFSGLQINFHKSTLVPISVDDGTASEIARLLGCPVSSFPCTYLGLPLSVNKITHGMLLPVIHKVDKRLSGWLATFLSWGGRLTLVNSVLVGIPSYLMSFFPWPKESINKLEGLLRAFFWQGKSKAFGGHCLVAWDRVVLPLYAGGLGVRDLSTHNQVVAKVV